MCGENTRKRKGRSMSITVKTFDDKKIIESMTKEQKEYLKAHATAIEGYKQTVAQAINKIKDVTNENEVLRKALIEIDKLMVPPTDKDFIKLAKELKSQPQMIFLVGWMRHKFEVERIIQATKTGA
jgi:predicted Rossmann fold nucleotide-binding protein DprA/Smf involved in DNA uptake